MPTDLEASEHDFPRCFWMVIGDMQSGDRCLKTEGTFLSMKTSPHPQTTGHTRTDDTHAP
jgi:hypothetical protein